MSVVGSHHRQQPAQSYFQRSSPCPTACPRAAGGSQHSHARLQAWQDRPADMARFRRVVEYSSPEEARRAITELNEGQLFGRPAFLREVSLICSRHTATRVHPADSLSWRPAGSRGGGTVWPGRRLGQAVLPRRRLRHGQRWRRTTTCEGRARQHSCRLRPARPTRPLRHRRESRPPELGA